MDIVPFCITRTLRHAILVRQVFYGARNAKHILSDEMSL